MTSLCPEFLSDWFNINPSHLLLQHPVLLLHCPQLPTTLGNIQFTAILTSTLSSKKPFKLRHPEDTHSSSSSSRCLVFVDPHTHQKEPKCADDVQQQDSASIRWLASAHTAAGKMEELSSTSVKLSTCNIPPLKSFKCPEGA